MAQQTLDWRSPPKHHVFNEVKGRWFLTYYAVSNGIQPRVRWNHDAAWWYDRQTGEVHSPFLHRGRAR